MCIRFQVWTKTVRHLRKSLGSYAPSFIHSQTVQSRPVVYYVLDSGCWDSHICWGDGDVKNFSAWYPGHWKTGIFQIQGSMERGRQSRKQRRISRLLSWILKDDEQFAKWLREEKAPRKKEHVWRPSIMNEHCVTSPVRVGCEKRRGELR